ncbi:MAG: DUF4129 domain-containing protein [Dehalococcoidia bacterium]
MGLVKAVASLVLGISTAGITTVRSNFLGIRGLNAERAIPFLVVLAEVLWAYPWLVWISSWEFVGWTKPPVSLGGAVVLATGAEVVPRLLLTRNWSLDRMRLVALSFAIILLALVVRLELGGGYAIWDPDWKRYALDHLSPLIGGLAFGTYFLWRGISVGSERPSFDTSYRRFIIGLTALVLLLALWGVTSRASEFPSVPTSAGIYLASYFVVGLLAIALVNFQSIRETMVRHQEAAGVFNRRWLSLLLGVVLAILFISLGIVSAFSFDLVALLIHSLNVLAGWLLIGFAYAVVLPVAWVVGGLVSLYQLLFGSEQEPVPIAPDIVAGQLEEGEGQEIEGIPPEVEGLEGFPPEAVLALKWGLFALIALLVLFILARALYRYRKDKVEDEVEEIRESLWSWTVFRADLSSLLATLLRRFRRQKPVTPAVVFPPSAVEQAEEQERRFTVREIYQGLLWEGRGLGLPRQQPETPYEYQSKLQRYVDRGGAEIEAITKAYVANRYGGADIDSERLTLLNRLWRRLRSVLRGEELIT